MGFRLITSLNLQPTIDSTPAPVFDEGTAATYAMSQHVTDDGVTALVYTIVTTLGAGLTFNSSTGVLTYDGSGAASTTEHQLEVSDQENPTVTSIAFNIVVNALSTATTIVAAAGGDFTSFHAAIAAAAPGDVIEGQAATPGGTFDDLTGVTANVDGANGNPIVIRGRVGDTIKISGTVAGNTHVQWNSDWLDFGENILFEGSAKPGTDQTTGGKSDTDRSIILDGSNNILRGSHRNSNLHSVWNSGANNRIIGPGYQELVESRMTSGRTAST